MKTLNSYIKKILFLHFYFFSDLQLSKTNRINNFYTVFFPFSFLFSSPFFYRLYINVR